MTIPVPIDELAEELDILNEDARVYVNRRTGEFITVPNGDIGVIEDGEEEDRGFEWEWSAEQLGTLREIVETENWFALPSQFEIHGWSLMQKFAQQSPEPLAERFMQAIHGRGAFRAFRGAVERAGVLDDWYRFKHEQLVGLTAEVLDEEGVPYKRGRG